MKSPAATAILGLLVGILIGLLIGIVMGNRTAIAMFEGPDYVDRLLERCFFQTTVAVDAKQHGLPQLDLSSASLETCRNFIDFASENLPVSDEQKAHLARQKAMIVKNFPELGASATGQKPGSKP
jgi:hypothetical protein